MFEIFQELPWFLKTIVFSLSFGAATYLIAWILKRFIVARIAALILLIGAMGWYFVTGGSDGPRSLNVGDSVLHEDELN